MRHPGSLVCCHQLPIKLLTHEELVEDPFMGPRIEASRMTLVAKKFGLLPAPTFVPVAEHNVWQVGVVSLAQACNMRIAIAVADKHLAPEQFF